MSNDQKKLKRYLFSDKDSSCNMTLVAPSEEEAIKLLEEKVVNANRWRLEEVEDI